VNQRFNRAGYEVIVRVQSPIRLSKTSLPQPDVSILRADPDFYVDGHPTPADVYLVIEVVDSTEKRDRELKLPLCAQAGIPEVWLVYRRRAVVVQHLDPQGGVYQRIREFKRGSSISPAAFPNVVIAVDDILGKRR
jgi:Uma2 family endonuclease